MLKKRIIPCLDIKDGRTVKGVAFENLKDAGDPVELARIYADEGADELIFLDISATVEQRKTWIKLVEKIAQVINIPFTVGGGISSVADAKLLIEAGADKISINSSAVKRPDMINELAAELGSQCVVVAIDSKLQNEIHTVYVNGGKVATSLTTVAWAQEAAKRGAGELLLTSMNHDGAKSGFAIAILNEVSNAVNIPVIASGGAGSMAHFTEVFQQTQVGAALAASIFHYKQITIPQLKSYLKQHNIPVR